MSKEKHRKHSEKKLKKRIKRSGKKYCTWRPKPPILNKEGGLTQTIVSSNVFGFYRPNQVNRTFNFTNSIVKNILNPDVSKIILDFTKVTHIKSPAFLFLYATLDNLLKEERSTEIEVKLPENARALRHFELSRFSDLCNGTLEEDYLLLGNSLLVRGSYANYRDKIIDFIQEEIYKNDMTPDEELILGSAIHEAIENIGEHAYIDNDNVEWWLSCSVISNQLYLVVYDLGVGIPGSFQKGNKLYDSLISIDNDEQIEIIQELIEKFSLNISVERVNQQVDDFLSNVNLTDGQKIALAMEGDITSVEGDDELKHGQGSKSIKALVDENIKGKLWIFSQSGRFMFKNAETLPDIKDLEKAIPGTLIQWNIRLKT